LRPLLRVTPAPFAALVLALAACGGGSEPQVPIAPIGTPTNSDGAAKPKQGRFGGDGIDPLAWRPEFEVDLSRRAALGNSHVLYAKSPDGVFPTARRVARFRSQVERAADRSDIDPDTLEAIVFLESAGRAEVVAGDDVSSAAGLTQILAETGTSQLGMRVDVARSQRLTGQIAREEARGHPARAARLRAQRRRADERFDPAKALAATVRYLESARKDFGRPDLAVVSYHMGFGNLHDILDAYGEQDIPYAQLYFDSNPRRHGAAWRKLAALGDESSTYYWRVLAAREMMRLYRSDPDELERLALLQQAKGSAEEVLHPRSATQVFDGPSEIARAVAAGRLKPIGPGPAGLGFRRDRRMGELARKLRQPRARYRALRPESLALARWIGATLPKMGGGPAPLVMTSTVRDQRYQTLLVETNVQATRAFSLHTTGFAFDVLRRYRSRAQEEAFGFLLGRLQSLNLLAWVLEPGAIHITASSEAGALALSGGTP